MPFDFHSPQDDSLTTVRSRLELLRDILAIMPAGQQGTYETCLWRQATKHEGLLAAGLSKYVDDSHRGPNTPAAAAGFFGLYPRIWGTEEKRTKLAYIEIALSGRNLEQTFYRAPPTTSCIRMEPLEASHLVALCELERLTQQRGWYPEEVRRQKIDQVVARCLEYSRALAAA